MFFSGDPSNRKRVDLGGRSSKERDRNKLLEQAKIERNKRLWLRQQNSAAIVIQKCFRGRKVVKTEVGNAREQFYATYGKNCERVDRQCFGPDSDFLQKLLYFFSPRNVSDLSTLAKTCDMLSEFTKDPNPDPVTDCEAERAEREAGRRAELTFNLFGDSCYSSKHALVNYRVKKLAYACIQAVHLNRDQFEHQLFSTFSDSDPPPSIRLLKAAKLLTHHKLPWSCNIISYLLQQKIYKIFREIVITGKESSFSEGGSGKLLVMDILGLAIAHTGQGVCVCPDIELQWSFASQILTIPFVWKIIPTLKEIYVCQGSFQHYLHRMAACTQSFEKILPVDISAEFPSYACLLGNTLEVVRDALARDACPYDMAIDFASVATLLLEVLPPIQSSYAESIEENSIMGDDDMIIDEAPAVVPLNKELEKQILNAIDLTFLPKLTDALLSGSSLLVDSSKDKNKYKEAAAVGAVCSFLHVTFTVLPLESVMTVLAYRTELVSVLWNFIKRSHEDKNWSSSSLVSPYLPGDAFGWLLPLAVFCPIYNRVSSF